MTGRDEISSTEKLLGVIRNERQALKLPMGFRKTAGRSSLFSSSNITKKISLGKTVTVGVVAGHKDLTLAMMRSLGERKYTLLDFQKIPLGAEMGRGQPHFPLFLKNALKQFCGDHDNIQLWTSIPSARVEIRFVKIPKVPENQIANAVYWSYKKLVPFDDREMIFDFELLGEAIENSGRRIQAIAYSAPRAEVESWKKLFSDIGFPLTGLSIVPFALQNLFRTHLFDHQREHICTLYIGQDWSRIDIFSEGRLVLSRDIKTGMNSFIESIRWGLNANKQTEAGGVEAAAALEYLEAVAESRPPDQGLQAAGFDEAKRVFLNILRPSNLNDPGGIAVGPGGPEILGMIAPVLDRLIRQVERTLEHFSLHFDHKSINKLYLGGEISGRNPIVEMMNDQFGYPIHHLNPFSTSIIPLDHPRLPQTVAEKDSFVPAIGLALSNKALTPNLLYTYRSKAIQTKIQRMNQVVFSAFIFLILVCLGIYYHQEKQINQKKEQAKNLEQQYTGKSPIIDQDLVQQMVAKVSEDNKQMVANAQRYLGVSILNELAELTPGNICLTNIKLELGSGEDKGRKSQHVLFIEGVVADSSAEQESDLAQYLFALNSSPLFKQSTVLQKTVENRQGGKRLGFKMKVETI